MVTLSPSKRLVEDEVGFLQGEGLGSLQGLRLALEASYYSKVLGGHIGQTWSSLQFCLQPVLH